jgi:hypothetical protein
VGRALLLAGPVVTAGTAMVGPPVLAGPVVVGDIAIVTLMMPQPVATAGTWTDLPEPHAATVPTNR